MSGKIIERVPQVKPGLATCLSCVKANLRGGENTCPIKELRDSPTEGRMVRSERGEQFECGHFKAVNSRQAAHRVGHVEGKEAAGQESLF